MLITKLSKSKVLSRGFSFFDSENENRATQFLHIYCLDVCSRSSAPDSNKQIP